MPELITFKGQKMSAIPTQTVLDNMVKEMTDNLLTGMREPISKSLHTLLNENVNKAVREGEFYRRLNEEMMNGIQNIFKEIKTAKNVNEKNQAETSELFSEASRQLDEILTTTEQAAADIMTIVERHMDLQEEATNLIETATKTVLDAKQAARLLEINNALADDLPKILTSLSFQDLTGQRIKKVIDALGKIETTALELFVSTGLALKAHQQEPGKDMDTIKKEAKQTASKLKGPTLDANQADVDDLLAQLGL